jgi:hypothetical protein
MSLSRRRMLQLGAGLIVAGAAAVFPPTVLQADSTPPPLPDCIRQSLQSLASLGFGDVVAIYDELRPSIEMQPKDVLTYGGITDGWASSSQRTATIQFRADLERAPLVLMGIVAHELLHVRQFTYDPDLYANCLAREVAAYRLEASVLRAWCKANPSLQYGISVDSMNLMSVAEESFPETIESYAAKASCGAH